VRKLSVEWFTGVPADNKERFEETLRNSGTIVRQLLLLIDKWEEELDAAESKTSDYDNPSWSAKQAHRNGDRSRLRKLRDLLSFLKE